MSRFVILLIVVILSSCSSGEEKMNLLFVTFDTTRADAMSVYGNDRIQTPNTRRLAEEGVVFERAYASSPITLPSHSTMMTGLHPFNHGVRDNGVFVLDDAQITLAEVLRDSGWATGAAIASFPLTRRFGIDQGFEFFDDEVEAATPTGPNGARRLFFDERPAGRVNAAVFGWLQANAARPFFLWVHYFDAHHPLQAPPPYGELYADPYYAEVAYADENLGVLLAEVDRLGVADRTVVVLAGDHGEGRGQHREETHALLAYDSTLHIPMVIKVPGGSRSRRVPTPVGLIDLFPTLLEILRVDPPTEVDGRSLASVFSPNSPDPPPVPLYAETMSPRISNGWGELRSLRQDGIKVIHGPRSELFDVDSDPGELHSLMVDREPLGETMLQRLEAFLDSNVRGAPSEQHSMDTETLAQLEALGYLHGGGDGSAIEERLNEGGVPPQDKIHLISQHSNVKNLLFAENYRQARALAEDLVGKNPENSNYVCLLASAELHLGLYDEAVDRLIPVLDPGNSETVRIMAMSFLGNAELTTDRAIRMIGAIEKSEAAMPTATGQYLTARCLLQLGRPEEGENALRRALLIDPGHHLSKVFLGLRLVLDHRDAEGRSFLEEAVAESPFSVDALHALGAYRQRMGDPESARGLLERALELEPRNTEVMHALVLVYLATDREEEARSVLATMRVMSGPTVEELTVKVENRWPST
jgi:arylsulfatase A-like enzyme/thioredoxin-like negative regulator of GroEL